MDQIKLTAAQRISINRVCEKPSQSGGLVVIETIETEYMGVITFVYYDRSRFIVTMKGEVVEIPQ